MPGEALLSSRPLSGTPRDRELLIGRKETVTQVAKAINFGLNVLVLGDRGVGKTSFLHTCEWALRHQQHTTVWINGAFMESAVDLVDSVAYQLEQARAIRVGSQVTQMLTAMSGTQRILGAPSPVLGAIRHLASRLGDKAETSEKRPVIIVDDLPADVAHDLFGRARDDAWQLPLIWLVAGDKARSADYLKAPADSFFGKVIELSPLSLPDARMVLRSRADDRLPEALATRIVEQAKGNPRRLIALATDALVEGEDNAEAVLERDSEVARRVRELGSSAQRLWEALQPMDQVTTNDQQFLDRLGWSRVRASQVLNQLEAAGLVESTTEKSQTGRPRKVYRRRSVQAAAS